MAAANVCQVCESPLKIEFIPDEDEIQSSSAALQVPDDVMLLACQHHFHWQCLLDSFNNACPSCNTDVTTGAEDPKVLVNIENEGGVSENQDVYRVLAEEQYLRHAPNERKARAFLEFCKEGDVDAVVDMLLQPDEEDDIDEDMMDDDDDEEDVPQMPLPAVLKYQDPLNNGMTALQAAVLANSTAIAWLLLWAASSLDAAHFPAAGVAHAQQVGIHRGLTDVDIRTLRDSKGRSAEDIAKELGGSQWIEFIGNQRLDL